MAKQHVKQLVPALVLCLPLACGASTDSLKKQIDHLRDTAMQSFEQSHDQHQALRLNAKAIRLARHLPASSWRVIENYDDAGRYYFESGLWKASAQHQAIAVLLPCGEQENAHMFATYVKRLGFAFSKYRPSDDFSVIESNPLILLQDLRLNLRSYADLRRRYFTTILVRAASANQRARYRYKLKTAALPASCCLQKKTA